MTFDLSIIVAVYNEDPRNLVALVERLKKVLSPLQLSQELIFVNDGSERKTTHALRQIAQELDYVKLLELSRNFGQQAAISAGFDHAEGRALINLDSDLQDPPELIPEMVKYWRAGYDVVYAQRAKRRDRVSKRFASFIFYRLLSTLSATEIPWDTGDFRLVDRKVADQLKRLPEKSRFLRGLIPWLGFKQIGIVANREARQVGESTYTLRKLVGLAFDGLLSFSVAPLYLVLFLGCVLVMAGLVAIIAWSIFGTSPLNWQVAIILSAITIFGGVQLIGTGLVAIYLSKVLEEARARPAYIVANRIGRAFGRAVSLDAPDQTRLKSRTLQGKK